MNIITMDEKRLRGHFYRHLENSPEAEEYDFSPWALFHVSDLLTKYHKSGRVDLERLSYDYLKLLKGFEQENPIDLGQKLHQLGDKTLFLTGFHHDMILKKKGSAVIDFYCEIGSGAYQSLSLTMQDKQVSEGYYDLSAYFRVF